MKKFSKVIAVLAVLMALIFVGCDSGTSSTEVGVGNMDFNVMKAATRAIHPDIDMGIDYITIRGESQVYPSADFEFTYNYNESEPETQVSLYVGAWNISLLAYNDDDQLIGSASDTVNVWINETVTAMLVVQPIEGTGVLNLTVEDLLLNLEETNLPIQEFGNNYGRLANVYIEGETKKLGGETEYFRVWLDRDSDIDHSSFVYDEYRRGHYGTWASDYMWYLDLVEFPAQTRLPVFETGWYDIKVRIVNGNIYDNEADSESHVVLSDWIVSTFRIVADQTTTGALYITADETYLGAAGFSVDVDMENMIDVELSRDGGVFTALTTDAVTGETVPAVITWYVNGDEVIGETGSTLTLDLTTAGYDLDGLRYGVNKVTARAEYQDGLGNADITFEVLEPAP